MTARIVDELDPPHQVSEPAALSGPVVCNSPHSGRSYLSRFIAQSSPAEMSNQAPKRVSFPSLSSVLT